LEKHQSNKKVLIVGANGSLGSCLTNAIKDNGWAPIITSSKKDSGCDLLLDLRSKESIEALKDLLPEILGIIFVAGKEPSQNLEDMTWEHLGEMIDIHFKGVLWCIKNFKEKIQDQGFIVLTSSIAARKGSYDPSYSSTKSAIEGLVRSLSQELSPKIRVNGVAPGLIKNSTVFNIMTDDFKSKHLENIPLKKFATTETVASAYLFLMENTSMNGQIIHVNGGQLFG